ncbi:MAG: hypothetical protein WAL98_13425 [Desulfatiglandaceae bacterium]|jgi:hypothetical protein
MKKLFRLLWTLIIIGIFCASASAQEKKAPKLIIRNAVFDAGVVNEGKIVKHTFLIYNQGNEPLRILDVKPG